MNPRSPCDDPLETDPLFPDLAAPSERGGRKIPGGVPPELSPERVRQGPLLLMAQRVYQEIVQTLTWPPETFGLLLGPKDHDSVVTHFHFDAAGQGTAGSFTIDHAGLNEVLKHYVAAKLDCKGYIHAHPPDCAQLSHGDFAAVRALFAKEKNRSLQRFLMPLVVVGQLLPYVVFREDLDDGEDLARDAHLVLF